MGKNKRLVFSLETTKGILESLKGSWTGRCDHDGELHTTLKNLDGTTFFLNKDDPDEMRGFATFVARASGIYGIKTEVNPAGVVYLTYQQPFFI